VKPESIKGQLKHLKIHTLPKDKIIFWDTSFVVDVLFSPNLERVAELRKKTRNSEEGREFHKLEFLEYRHDAAVDFAERLINENVNIAFSSILFHELYFVFKYIELDKVYKDRKKTNEELKKNPKILTTHIPAIVRNWELFMNFLSKFKNRVVSISPSDPDIIKEILRIQITHGLNPNDSIHLGTMLAGKRKDIVVFDKRFKDAALQEGLNVWWKF